MISQNRVTQAQKQQLLDGYNEFRAVFKNNAIYRSKDFTIEYKGPQKVEDGSDDRLDEFIFYPNNNPKDNRAIYTLLTFRPSGSGKIFKTDLKIIMTGVNLGSDEINYNDGYSMDCGNMNINYLSERITELYNDYYCVGAGRYLNIDNLAERIIRENYYAGLNSPFLKVGNIKFLDVFDSYVNYVFYEIVGLSEKIIDFFDLLCMLTEEDYKKLWETHFQNLKGIKMPPYCEYIDRENMLEDYLDIFRGINTRNLRPIPPCKWHYTHPFFNSNGSPKLKTKPFIKYIMIGEAAPPSIVNYFYYTGAASKQTGYFTAPCKAFGVITGSKEDKLIALANKGVLLLDLFPFALDYNKLRDKLISNNAVIDFWDNKENPYSVINRLLDIVDLLDKISVSSALIAPPKISHHIAVKLNAVTGQLSNLGLTFRMGGNQFIPKHIINKDKFFIKVPLCSKLNNTYNIPINKMGTHCIQVPIYACCCYSGSQTVPHELFIRNAFYLP